MLSYFFQFSWILLYVLMIIISGCSNKSKLADRSFFKAMFISEYYKYIQDTNNSFIINKNIDHFKYTVTYEPRTLIALRSMEEQVVKNDRIQNKDKLLKAVENISENCNFKMVISGDRLQEVINDSDPGLFMRYYAFQNKKNYRLINEGDTLNASYYQFDNIIGIRPVLMFIIGFECEEATGTYTLVYNDEVLTKTRPEFNYHSSIIFKTPSIKGL